MNRDCPRCCEPMLELGLSYDVDLRTMMLAFYCRDCGEERLERPCAPFGWRSEWRSKVARVLANRRPT